MTRRAGLAAAPETVLTIDIHESDEPTDIERCLDYLSSIAMRATFFIPTAMLDQPRFRSAFSGLATSGHELGTHGHDHDLAEMRALSEGPTSALQFLSRSTELFEQYFGRKANVFRSPSWCGMGARALDELERLRYAVDSSATPQRLGLFSAFPLENPYLFASRSPRFLRPGLLEVPTSTALVPAGAPTFQTLRMTLSLLMLRALCLEAAWVRSRVIVVQMHAGDLVGNPMLPRKAEWRLSAFLPARQGGIQARKWIRMRDPNAIMKVSRRVVMELRVLRVGSLAEVHHSVQGSDVKARPDGQA